MPISQVLLFCSNSTDTLAATVNRNTGCQVAVETPADETSFGTVHDMHDSYLLIHITESRTDLVIVKVKDRYPVWIGLYIEVVPTSLGDPFQSQGLLFGAFFTFAS